MTLTKLAILSTTALTLSLSAAMADGNDSSVTQDGADNSALVNQDLGADGSADGGANQTATVDQDGDDNTADVLQQGDGNNTTVTQDGDDNRADNRSVGDSNTVTVSQGPETVVIPPITIPNPLPFGPPVFVINPGSTNLVGGNDNESDVTVDGDGNTVDVTQIRDGNASDVSVEGDSNDVDVTQDDAPIVSGNSSTVAIRNGDANIVRIDQDGENASGVEIVGDDNDVDVEQSGSNASEVDILGADNDVDVAQDGISGIGVDNNSDVMILGDVNEVGVAQFGANNLSMVDIIGGSNNVVIDQVSLLVRGSDSDVGITGNDNDVSVMQSGNNSADVQLNGGVSGSLDSDNNLLVIDQSGGTFGENTITVGLWGDDNNRSTGGNNGNGFSGDAATFAALDGRLVPGTLTQSGSGNSILLEVGSSGTEADDNLFSFLQDGNRNSITGSIASGFGNEVAVVQVGSDSSTSFSQTGNYNNLGVSQ